MTGTIDPRDTGPRPVLVTVACLIGFTGILAALSILLLAPAPGPARPHTPALAVARMVLLAVALAGYWRMKRWGVWLSVAVVMAGLLYDGWVLRLSREMVNYLPALVTVAIGLMYHREMT